jgi:pimeloyl-ACP methyl ester carboxylesterase
VKRVAFIVVAVAFAWTVAVLLRPRPGGLDPVPPHESASGARAPEATVSRLPVLLVPGWLDTDRDMAALRISLIRAGWAPESVRAVSFDDPAGSNRDHAEELHTVARALLRETGLDSLDVVAYSMGGLATRWYLLRDDAVAVRRLAFLATPHRGTLAAHLAWGDGREEMMPESPFLDTLNARALVPAGVEVMTVRTSFDTHVIPGESATLPGVPDVEICCPTHPGLLTHAEVFAIVRRFLETGEVRG